MARNKFRIIKFPFPLKGENKNFASIFQPPITTFNLNNVRVYDVLDERARGGQRPGLNKRYQQKLGVTGAFGKGIFGQGLFGVGSGSTPIVAMCQVTTVEH